MFLFCFSMYVNDLIFLFVFSVYTFKINSIGTNQILIIKVLLCLTISRRVAVFQRERLLGFLRKQKLARGSRGLSTERRRPADHQHQGGTGPCVCVCVNQGWKELNSLEVMTRWMFVCCWNKAFTNRFQKNLWIGLTHSWREPWSWVDGTAAYKRFLRLVSVVGVGMSDNIVHRRVLVSFVPLFALYLIPKVLFVPHRHLQFSI